MSEHMKALETRDFIAFIADNDASGIHRAGYNGVASLVLKSTGNNIFVPRYCGLNYEITLLEGLQQSDEEIFEPRRSPMSIIESDASHVVLHQPETALKGIEALITFRVEEPYYVHQNVRLTFHKPLAEGRAFESLWASYLHQPPDGHAYLKGPGGDLEGWYGATKERHRAPYYIIHDLPAHELTPAEHVVIAEEPPTPPRMGKIEAPLEFYYGLYFDHTFLMMFRDSTNVRFAYSPNGGNPQPPLSPALDYVLTVPRVELGRVYEWDLCCAVKPSAGRRDILEEVRRYRG